MTPSVFKALAAPPQSPNSRRKARLSPSRASLAIAARTARVFVLTGNATVVMLDTTTETLLRTLTLGALPYAVAIDERAARVFVDTADGQLDMLDAATGALLHGAALGGHPGAIAVDADRSRVVVSTVTATQERVAVFDARADRRRGIGRRLRSPVH